MSAQDYHKVRNTQLSHLTDLSQSELLAYARTCSRRTRLKLLAVGAVLLNEGSGRL